MEYIFSIAILLASFSIPRHSHSAEALLRWDPPVQSDGTAAVSIAGYSVSVGSSPGTYSQVIPVGDVTTYTVTGLLEGKTYYFATKAQDAQGNESAYSNEASKLIPVSIANYSIAASASLGGSISPSGSITASSGQSRTFQITPNKNYVVSSVVVDGVSTAPSYSYTFTNVAGNHTIRAIFAKKRR